VLNGRRYNRTDQTSRTQFIVPTAPWCHHHHHHRHAPPPAAAAVCKGSIVHPAAATRHHTSVQELVVDAEAPSTKRHLRRHTLTRKGLPYHNHGLSMASSSSSSSSSSSLPSPPSSPPSPVIYLIVVFLSVIVFSPLPHPVVATRRRCLRLCLHCHLTPLRVICLIVVFVSSSLIVLSPLGPPALHFVSFVDC